MFTAKNKNNMEMHVSLSSPPFFLLPRPSEEAAPINFVMYLSRPFPVHL